MYSIKCTMYGGIITKNVLIVAMSDRKWGVVRNVYVFVLLRVRDQLVAAKE